MMMAEMKVQKSGMFPDEESAFQSDLKRVEMMAAASGVMMA